MQRHERRPGPRFALLPTPFPALLGIQVYEIPAGPRRRGRAVQRAQERPLH